MTDSSGLAIGRVVGASSALLRLCLAATRVGQTVTEPQNPVNPLLTLSQSRQGRKSRAHGLQGRRGVHALTITVLLYAHEVAPQGLAALVAGRYLPGQALFHKSRPPIHPEGLGSCPLLLVYTQLLSWSVSFGPISQTPAG